MRVAVITGSVTTIGEVTRGTEIKLWPSLSPEYTECLKSKIGGNIRAN